MDAVHVDAIKEGVLGHGLHLLAEGGIMAAVQAGHDEAPGCQQRDAHDEDQQPYTLAATLTLPLHAGGSAARTGIGGRVLGLLRLEHFAIGRILGIAGIRSVPCGLAGGSALPGLSVVHARASFPSKCGFGYSLL